MAAAASDPGIFGGEWSGVGREDLRVGGRFGRKRRVASGKTDCGQSEEQTPHRGRCEHQHACAWRPEERIRSGAARDDASLQPPPSPALPPLAVAMRLKCVFSVVACVRAIRVVSVDGRGVAVGAWLSRSAAEAASCVVVAPPLWFESATQPQLMIDRVSWSGGVSVPPCCARRRAVVQLARRPRTTIRLPWKRRSRIAECQQQ